MRFNLTKANTDRLRAEGLAERVRSTATANQDHTRRRLDSLIQTLEGRYATDPAGVSRWLDQAEALSWS